LNFFLLLLYLNQRVWSNWPFRVHAGAEEGLISRVLSHPPLSRVRRQRHLHLGEKHQTHIAKAKPPQITSPSRSRRSILTHVCGAIRTHNPAMTDHNTHPDIPSRKSTSSPSPSNGSGSHRASFAENLRHSPRSQRHPSFTQSAVQELLQHPPVSRPSDPRFTGRDWKSIHVGELVQQSDVRWIELGTSVEDATKVCIPALMLLGMIADSYSNRHLSHTGRRMWYYCAKNLPIGLRATRSIMET
jgi:hypothetical protein